MIPLALASLATEAAADEPHKQANDHQRYQDESDRLRRRIGECPSHAVREKGQCADPGRERPERTDQVGTETQPRSAGDQVETAAFSLTAFDRELVEAGGWLAYADRKY